MEDTVTATTAAIEVRNLSRYFGATRAVDDISFAVRQGTVFGFIGPNGAGKTTTMRILATLDHPTSGEAEVAGFSVVSDPEQIRRRVGYMPDSFGSFSYMSCREYLDFFARAYGLRRSARRDAVSRTLAFTGTEGIADKPVDTLSMGMRQRLCLGRALIHDPDVLILDEPAAGLDPRARIELRGMIRDLADQGKSILVSSHILTELADFVDDIGILERGRLRAAGPLADVRRRFGGKRVVELAVEGDSADVAVWLQNHLDTEEITCHGDHFCFICPDDSSEIESDLLSRLVAAGFRVKRFGIRESSLEDLFMDLTEGEVA